jgi:hypothetical protein
MTVRSAADGLVRYWRGIDSSWGVGGTREEASRCLQFVLDHFEAVARSEVPCLYFNFIHLYSDKVFKFVFRPFEALDRSEVPRP